MSSPTSDKFFLCRFDQRLDALSGNVVHSPINFTHLCFPIPKSKKVESKNMTSTATATAPERQVAGPQIAETHTDEKLIRTICLTAQPMTREAFEPYGELIGERGGVELDLGGGCASVVAQTVEPRPLTFDFLGRHERTEQVFAPLGGARSIIAVAPPCEDGSATPDANRMAAFVVDGACAFKLHRGAWHTSAFPLDKRATFLVLDREGTLEEDFDLRDLKTSLGVVVEIKQ